MFICNVVIDLAVPAGYIKYMNYIGEGLALSEFIYGIRRALELFRVEMNSLLIIEYRSI